MADSTTPRPRRGRPRLVDRDRIIAAAKTLDPSTLTMQALAEAMGVDRKTLHYHVENRESLLRLTAADAFKDAVAVHSFVPTEDWRDCVRSFATITREAVITAGAWASYVAFDGADDLEAVRPAEIAAEALVKAGLSEQSAGRVVATLAVLAFASARDLSASPLDRHPQEPVLQRALEHEAGGQFALIRRLVGSGAASLGSESQFTFELDLVLLGVERMLEIDQEPVS